MAAETKSTKTRLADYKQTRRVGIWQRSLRAIKNATFELGLSSPGQLWYRNSTVLSDREKAWLDGELNRIIQ